MTQQKWTTIVLAVLTVGLGAHLWFFEKAFQTEPDLSGPKRVFKGQAEQVSSLVIESEYGRFVFRKLEDEAAAEDEDEHGHYREPRWEMVEPTSDLADSTTVMDVVRGVIGLRAGSPLEGEDEAVFGLDEPRLEIQVDGVVEGTVEVGKPTPLGTSVYVRFRGVLGADDDAVHVVSGNFVNSALRPAEGFRSRSLGAFSPAVVRKIELETRKGGTARTISIAKSDKTRPWEMSAPYAEPCGPGAVDGFLMALMRLRGEEFVEEGADPAAHGLAEPYLTVNLWDEEGRLKFGPVAIGRVEKDGAVHWYGRMEGRKTILSLGTGVQGLEVDADHFRLRRIFEPLTGADIVDTFVGFRFGTLADHWSLSQVASGEWRIVLHSHEPGGSLEFRVNPQAVRDFKDVLRKFEIADFVSEEPTPEQLASWGLEPNKARWALGFILAGEPDAKVIWFGNVEGEGREQKVYAQIDGRGKSVVRLGAEAARFSVAENHRAEDFRDRLVWEVPSDAKVVSIESTHGDGKKAAADAEGKWPEESKYWPYRIRRIVTRDYPAGWASMTGQVETPVATLKIGWQDGKGEAHETVIRYETVPERPKAEEEMPDAPQEVRASVEGVPGVFYLIPFQVWDHLDVAEPK